jgi:formate-dependent nitrite reductase membrane component NrfD
MLFGFIEAESSLWQWAAPVVSGVFLGLTGLLLIWDLDQPLRFYMIFTKAHWRSWLVRGAFVIGGYSAVLGLHFLANLLGQAPLQGLLAWPGLPLGVMTAVYTAYLFAQARARDLWQSPLLPPHLLVQSLFAGAAALLPWAALAQPEALRPLLLTVAGTGLVHLLMILGETTLAHTTAHAHLATWEMTRGRFKNFFRIGIVLTIAAVAAPFLGPWIAAPVALLGLLAFEHAYVQAGQAVPLA